jgi:site-specific recombinase XerD
VFGGLIVNAWGYLGLSMGLFEASATLFHMGQIDAFPARLNHLARRQFEMAWEDCAPAVADVFRDYLAQRATVRRPSTINGERQGLMRFATFLAENYPDVGSLTQLQRPHIEHYKRFLAVKPTPRGGQLSKTTVYRNLALLRTVFDYLAETGHPQAPAGRLILPGDLSALDRPLPRFIDDGAAAELLRVARADHDAFTRIANEMLARTGLRISELLDLTTDAVVQIGSAYSLHVPLGKLHNDRYIPLHPQLKAMLDEWLADRPAGLRVNYIFMHHGRRISKQNLRIGLERVTTAAGIGHVTPHQLRHTLATQAINRGMSLEAIAALLGHKTLAMTQVYARIADKTVADEYFAVSEQVEALYGAPRELPADAEGREMRKLRAEMHRRMLGNGYCARPVELDCHFESICESCSFFVTTIEFRPTLQAQRDDAAHKGQVGRVRVFDGVLDRLEDDPGKDAA